MYAYRTAFDMPFTYPPFAAALAEPLGRVPLGVTQALWTAGTIACLVVVARLVLAPAVRVVGLPATVTVLLLTAPVRSHLRFGQVGALLVLLVAADLLRPAGSRLRGWGVGVAAALKLTPVVVLPWLLLTRSWAHLRGALLWATGCTLAGLLLVWPSTRTYLGSAAWDATRFGDNAIPGNQSLRGLLLRSGLGEDAVQALWLGGALVLALVGLRSAARLERAGQRLAAVGVLAALSCAVSPVTWVHHLLWLVFPVAALLAAGRHRLAVGWTLVLVPGLPALAHDASSALPALDPAWFLVGNLPGLSAIAAVVLLAVLVRTREAPASPELTPAVNAGRAGATGTPGRPGRPGRTARSR